MVITEVKPLKEILESLDGYDNIIVLGCSECAEMCKTGGQDEIDQMTEILTENGKTVVGSLLLTTPCNQLLTKKELKSINDLTDESDAILSLSCGNGTQTISRFYKKPIIPANNTKFVGERIRSGIFEENCRTCGDCVLGRTAAICPVSRCAKGLLNGPCGGSIDGKCEVNPENDCAWILIYNKLRNQDKIDQLEEIYPLRSYRDYSEPRNLNLRKKNEHK